PPPSRTEGQNPPAGAGLIYPLKNALSKDAQATFEILDDQGKLVRRFNSKAEQAGDKIEPKKGMKRFVWKLRYAAAESFPGMILWGSVMGPRAAPGKYQARLKVGDASVSVDFEIKPDPRASAKPADYNAQLHFLLAVRDKLTEIHRGIKQIRE